MAVEASFSDAESVELGIIVNRRWRKARAFLVIVTFPGIFLFYKCRHGGFLSKSVQDGGIG